MKEAIAGWPGWFRRLLQLVIGYALAYTGVTIPGFEVNPDVMAAIAVTVAYIVGGITPLDQGMGLFKVRPSQIGR
jgi:hypothetical protein